MKDQLVVLLRAHREELALALLQTDINKQYEGANMREQIDLITALLVSINAPSWARNSKGELK